MVTHAIDTYGRLDYVVNNAGIEGNFAPIVDLPDDEWDRVLDINLKGAFLCMKHESRAMLETGRRGAIVNVGSVNSFLGDAIFYPAVLPGVHLQRAGATGRNRSGHRLPVLRRGQLHHRLHADAGRRFHAAAVSTVAGPRIRPECQLQYRGAA